MRPTDEFASSKPNGQNLQILENYITDSCQTPSFNNQLKPAIMQCLGDMAQAIGPNFEKYVDVVAGLLVQAMNINAGLDNTLTMMDYVVSLREGIMDAWSGIVLAMKSTKGL